MKKEYEEAISKIIGCEPFKINSALVSAQNRQRLYWTNLPNPIIKDRSIFKQCKAGLRGKLKSG